MKCTYKIKKPDGGVIIIPADFGLISKNKRVREAYEDAIETNNTTELVNTLTELSGKTMNSSQVYNIVSDNLQDLDIIIDEMNESIPQNAEYNNFEKALYKYLSSNDVNLEGIEESLKQPIKLDYLDDVNPIGLLDQTSLQKEHSKVKTEIAFSRETGLPSEIMVEMDKFFSAIQRKDSDTYNSNNLLSNHSVLGARSANVGNYTVYSKGSYDSLFLGIFKRLGNSLNKNIVKDVLGSETYFSTTSDAEGAIENSLFEKDLLSKDAKNKSQITKAIKLVAEYLGGDTNSLINSITNLFSYLSPEIFINEQLLRTKRAEQTAVNDRESNEEYQLKSSEDYLNINKEDLGMYYAPAKRASYDLLNFLSSTITLGQDLVQIPLSENNKPYILVTEISGTEGLVRVSGIQNIEGVETIQETTVEENKGKEKWETHEVVNKESSAKYFSIGDYIFDRDLLKPNTNYKSLHKGFLVEDVDVNRHSVEGDYHSGNGTPQDAINLFKKIALIPEIKRKPISQLLDIALKDLSISINEWKENIQVSGKIKSMPNNWGAGIAKYTSDMRAYLSQIPKLNEAVSDELIKKWFVEEGVLRVKGWGDPEKVGIFVGDANMQMVLDFYSKEIQQQLKKETKTVEKRVSTGKARFVDYVFKGKQDVFYRIKENPIQEAVLGETIDTTAEKTHASSNYGFKPDVLKALLRKGDIVNISISGTKTTNKTVVGVYPGYLVVDTNLNPAEINQSEDTLMIVPYNKVKHIYSAELKIRHDAALKMNLADLNGYSKVTDMSLLSEGDIIVDPTSSKGMFKVVLAADNSNIYTYYIGAEGKPGKIQRLSKKGTQTQLGIETAWSYAFNQITGAEASALVANFENNGTKEATMSSFTDPNGAKTNDFFISSEVSGKILDARSGKSVIVAEKGNEKTTRIVNFRDYEGLMFFTDKDVMTKYDMSILRVNNWRIFTDKSSLHNPKEVVYVIPKGYDKNKVYLFSNNYGNVGQYKDAEFVDSKRDQVITDHMISLIEKRDGIKIEGNKLYVNKIGPNSNVYHRDTVGLEQAFYFSTLDEEVKKELDVLKPGVYFKVTKENTLDYNFYRIMKVDGDRVTARINKINVNGDLLSFEKVFSAKELLATKGVNDSKSPVNSIYALFLQYGNRNMPLIKRAYDEKMSATQVESAKSIETVKYAMTQTFKELGIEVTEGVEGFADTQKAKIETTIQENGEHKVTIVLNNNNGEYTDLIHENIHIYLTLLRHTDERAYYDLIETIINQDSRFKDKHGLEADLSTKEEFVVNDLIRLTEGENNFLYKNLKNFMLSVNEVIKNTINPDYTYDLSKIVNNPVSFLNTTMRSLYGIDEGDNSHPFYNMGMLATETFMREWMIENNIKLKCD